jgi:two-component system, sensor histidine kinase
VPTMPVEQSKMSSPDSLRVLIIDDNPIDREAYRRLLLRAPDGSYKVIEAGSGSEGLELCRSARPDCVLLDYLLPDLSGLEFLAELGGDRGVTPVPVVMLTGEGNEHVDLAAMRGGAQDYLVKGEIDVTLLVRTIRHAIDRHQLMVALRDSEARVRAVLDTAVDGILTFDRHGFIIFLNPAAEPLFGYSAADIIGRSVQILLPEVHREVPGLAPGRRDSVEPVRVHEESFGQRHDGSRIPIDLTLSETRLGDDRTFTAIVRDMTARRRAEEAERLFLAATSHDVRNALNTILGYTEILKTAPTPEEADRAVTRIGNLVGNLCTVMNDIVVHAGAQDEKIVFKPIEIRPFVESCAKDVRAECRQRGLELRTELPAECTVNSDRTALARILNNLLSNAIRYTVRGEVLLRCEVTPAEIRFTVRDTGIGIPAGDLARVFEDHYRHPQARELQPLGTGLGLATARRLCAVLHGTVTAQSTPGEGSTFTVVLPRGDDS